MGTQSVDNGFGTGFGVMKYLDEGNNTLQFPGISSTDYLVFRYGEILLNLAEAAFELGETGEALEAVNDIRKRAGISPLESVDRDKIRHERKVELAFEGHRFWDVRRWEEGQTYFNQPIHGMRITMENEKASYETFVVEERVFEPKMNYYPIPQSELQKNSKLDQNPGW